MRKTRAINKSSNDVKKILELFDKGFKPAEIVRHFNNKYTYWQVYNTLPHRGEKGKNSVNENGEIIQKKLKAERTVTEMPDVDYSQFVSFENFLEHEITVIISQLNEKRITLEKRTFLLNKLADINKKLKAQQTEKHLKDANARLIIKIMRRLKPELSDTELVKIFKEESEKLKHENKSF